MSTATALNDRSTANEPLNVAFCCNWCSYAGGDLAGTSRMSYPANVWVIRVPCCGRMNPMFVLRAFQRGADVVLVASCHPGDCLYSTGNYHGRRRLSTFKRLAEFAGFEPERFEVRWLSSSEGDKFAKEMEAITEKIKALGLTRKMRDARWQSVE